ncbi:alpha-L-fucosidase [bacterium A37T11]|nr:alpha-L-fucosidase [bacterium A37T11]
MKNNIYCIGLLLLAVHTPGFGQVHNVFKGYITPTDPLVKKNLSEWQDLKFGLFMHWGLYAKWGIVESWSICPEDEGWTQRRGPYSSNYFEYVKAYENIQTTFNPIDFNPDKWAKAAKEAGMKYLVFTTKHHDGFAMFDTKQSDYKITGSKSAFSNNPKANIAKEVFGSFRTEGFKIGAYFSKPDWHSEYYWWPYFPPKDRNVNYEPKKYPERWQQYKDYTYNQIQELMTGYGKIDILWLDGGWVRPLSTVDTSVDWQRGIHTDQDIDMARIAGMARKNQPGLLVVDRTVPGEFENYVTPEQQVPEKPLDAPWESCITLGTSWGYVPNDQFKPAKEVVQLLVRIVSRGGSLLLDIGPSAQGDWDPVAYERLKQIGAWIKLNGLGIYGTKVLDPYSKDNLYFTQSKDGKEHNVFFLSNTDEVSLPASLEIPVEGGAKLATVRLVGVDLKLKWKVKDGILQVIIPKSLQQTGNHLSYAAMFQLQYK